MADNFQITQGSGTFVATHQNVDGTHEQKIQVTNLPATQSVVIDQLTGKTLVGLTNTLVTTAVTVDQVILTYTVTAGKTFYLQYVSADVRLTAPSATAAVLGTYSIEFPSGSKRITITNVNPTTSATQPWTLALPDPLPLAAGTVIRFVCTPAAVTSMTWVANFGGYEK